MNENEGTTHPNLWYAAKAVFRGKCKAVNVYIKKEERSQTNNLMFYLKTLENEEHTKPKVGSFPSPGPLQFPHQQLLSPRDVAFQGFTLFPKGCSLG